MINQTIAGNYYNDFALFTYQQTISELNGSDMLVDHTQVILKHDNTLYMYSFSQHELTIINNSGRICFFINNEEILSTLRTELPFEKYVVVEKEMFNRI